MKKFVIAHIREAECIGCTKCLQACPYDAIVGAAKQLHTVLKTECTGCGDCVMPCPVDCIDLLPIPDSLYDPVRAQQRLEARNRRLQAESAMRIPPPQSSEIKDDIKAAVARSRARAKNRRDI